MITSNSNYRTTLFYFNNVDQLRDFESFKICPVHAGQHIPDTEADKADYWCVIGIYKAEQARANQSPSFPVADLTLLIPLNRGNAISTGVSITPVG